VKRILYGNFQGLKLIWMVHKDERLALNHKTW